jgi:hypothetical protein
MMIKLPNWVQFTPVLFYFASALIFIGEIYFGFMETYGAAFVLGSGEAYKLATWRIILTAVTNAIYMFSSGLWLQVMIIIYNRISRFLDAREAAE